MPDHTELAQRFADFADTTERRSPLYSRITAGIATDPSTVALLAAAPLEQQSPVLLFAAVHDLVLRLPESDLARFYPSITGTTDPSAHDLDDPWPLFRRFCREHRDEVIQLVSSHHTQTNEVSRCTLFLPLLSMISADRASQPLAQIDVGCSAGLNLLWPQYEYRYAPGPDGTPTAIGTSNVQLDCATRGIWPSTPLTLPPAVSGIGLDPFPIDLANDDQRRWLRACVWPDQLDRLDRLDAAVALAAATPPDVRVGDAVADVATLVVEAAQRGHPVVTTSWCLNYLPVEQQRAFVDQLNDVAHHHDLSWIVAESPAQTPGLPIPTCDEPEHLTVLSLVTWRCGRRTVRRLATDHPHGYWLHWQP